MTRLDHTRLLRSYPALVLLVLAALVWATLGDPPQPRPAPPAARPAAGAFPALAPAFEANAGQWDASVAFVSRAPGYRVGLRSGGADVLLHDAESGRSARLALSFDGAAAAPLEGRARLPGRVHYLRGDAKRSARNVERYREVLARQLYPGIDAVYRSDARGRLEYDLYLAPHADPAAVRLRFDGADALTLDAQGDLLIATPAGPLKHRKPRAYQRIAGADRPVAVAYAPAADAHSVTLALGDYDRNVALLIDPVLEVAGYLGGTETDAAAAVAVGADGAVYVAGSTASDDFPLLLPYQSDRRGDNDLFIAKLSADGSALDYATYLGGRGDDRAAALAVDADGNVYLTGSTTSADFPLHNAWQPQLGGEKTRGDADADDDDEEDDNADAFAVKLGPGGDDLLYATYLGGRGQDRGTALALDAAGHLHLAGSTRSASGFPAPTPVAGQSLGAEDAFWLELDAAGALARGARLGGSQNDAAAGIALDAHGRVLLAGRTASKKDFPLQNAAQPQFGGGAGDAFLLALDPQTQQLVYATYFGGRQDDAAAALAVDRRNRAVIAGDSASDDLPGAARAQRGDRDAFIALFDADGAFIRTHTLGGRKQEHAYALAVGPSDSVTVAGDTTSPDFPLQGALQTQLAGQSDAFAARFDADGRRVFATVLGGEHDDSAAAVAVAGDGRALLAGSTRSRKTLPLVQPLQTALAGESDAYLAKLYINGAPVIDAAPLPAATEHQPYAYRPPVADPDGDTLSFALSGAPAGLSLSADGELRWDDPALGDYALTLTVTDSMGESAVRTFSLSVVSANRPPVIDTPPATEAWVGQPYRYTLQAHDPDGDPLSVELLEAPLGLYLTGQTLDWTPVAPGSAHVVLRVADPQGLSVEQAFDIHVAIAAGDNRPPQLDPVGNRTVLLGTMLNLQLTATDPDGDTLTFGAAPAPLPDGARFDIGRGAFVWQPQASQTGTWSFTFSVTDGQYSDRETVTVIVPDPDPQAPTRLIGRVVDATALSQGQDVPIVGSTIRVGDSVTTSDAHGDFTLAVPLGDTFENGGPFFIDNTGAQPAPDGSGYASFHVDMALIAHADNVMPRPFSLPRIETASLTQVDPNAETQVVNARLGVILTVPAGSAKNPDGSLYTGPLSISEVPRGFTPASMPQEYDPALIVTLQPLGVHFDPPAPLHFPNTDQWPSGAEPELISLNPDTGQFEAVGTTRVAADGSGLDTFEGGVRQTDWHYVATPPQVEPYNDCDCATAGGSDGDSSYGLNDGELDSAVDLPDTPLQGGGVGSHATTVSFNYRSGYAFPNPLLRVKASLGPFTAAPLTLSQHFELGGLQSNAGGSGSGAADVHFQGAPLQRALVRPQGSPVSFWFAAALNTLAGPDVDVRVLGSGTYPYRITLSNNYPASRYGAGAPGRVPLVNRVDGPFGAGWSLGGVTRLHIGGDNVLWETPRGLSRNFQIRRTANADGSVTESLTADPQQPPDARLATLEKTADGYLRRDKTGSEEHFDATGLLQYRQDRHGNRTTYRYAGDRLVAVEGPTGQATQLAYNAHGKLDTVTDAAGRRTRFVYDAAGNVSKIVLPDGGEHRFEYDDRHLLTAHTDPGGHTAQHVYDAYGRIDSGRRADGGTLKLHYRLNIGLPDGTHTGTATDPLGIPASDALEARYTDALNHRTRYTLDNGGRITYRLDALGRSTVYERDANGNATKITYPDQTEVVQTFNARNDLTSHLGPDNILTSFGYNQFSQVTQVTIQAPGVAARSTLFERDPQNGDLLSITDALQHKTLLQHDPQGRTTHIKMPDGQVTAIGYNALGLAETITRTAADAALPPRTTQIVYDDAGLPKTVTLPDGGVYRYQFDALDRLTQVTDALGQTMQISRDADGLPIRIERRDAQGGLLQSRTTDYDPRHRTTRRADHDVSDAAAPPLTATFQWDFESNLAQAIDPNRHATNYQYDAVDRLRQSLDPLNGLTKLDWDDSDNVTQVTAPNAAATQFKFDDPAHRQTLESSPDRGPVGVGYDADGRLATQTHANGAQVAWSYDALDRVLTETQTLPGQNPVTVHYSYDSCRLGKLCAIDDGTEQIAFAYTGFGQLDTETHSQDGKSVQTGYGYDDAGRLQQLILPSGRVIQYQRDALGRIVSLAADLNGQPQALLEQIGYRADGQLDRLAYGNGTVEQRSYDGYGRLRRQTLTQSNGQVLQQVDYQRDANGNLTQRKSEGLAQFPALTASYRYDGLDRLTQERYDLTPERNADYTFDANGNWLTRQQGPGGTEADELYRYAPKSNRLLDKDALRQADATPEPVKDVTYDAKQRVRTLSVGGRLTAEYRYDARNLRTKKTLYDDAGAVSAEVYYHYDANGLLIGESDAQGRVTREYVYLGLMPVAQIDIDSQGQESIVYLHADHLATPRLATDANQTIVWRWESDAYGNTPPQGLVTINLRLPGQYYDQESGWFYNWNRYYESGTGRYLTSDPIGLRAGLNTYAYAKGNPLRISDPTGLKSRVCCKRLGATLFAASHCYIETLPDGAARVKKAGLLGSWFSNQEWGTGHIYLNNGWEDSDSCGEWGDEQLCPSETDQCVKRMVYAYANPSEYNLLLGPNSNTFAGTVARACGLKKPSWHWTPGWDDPPAPQKSDTKNEPPKNLDGTNPW